MFKLINKMKNKKGFTLVELIIVLAVLVIIAAIAVPRFAKVQNDAKIDADYTTAKTIAKAVEMYMASTDGYNLGDTVTMSGIVSAGFLNSTPKEQYFDASSFSFSIDSSTGVITVTAKDGGTSKTLYPDPR